MTAPQLLGLTDWVEGIAEAQQADDTAGCMEFVSDHARDAPAWGAGPVGYFAIQSAKVLGAAEIIAIETVPERVALARRAGATSIIDFKKEDVFERIFEITRGKGADGVIDCVGMEASAGHGQAGLISAAKESFTSSERSYALDQAIKAVRPCGVVSVPGVYGGSISVNMGSVMQKGLTIRSGQTNVKRYLEPLTAMIQTGKIDTTSLITHRSTQLEDGPGLYKTFKEKKDGCVKVVFHPAG